MGRIPLRNRYEVRGDSTVIFIHRTGLPDLETIVDTRSLPNLNEFHVRWFSALPREKWSARVYVKATTPGKHNRTSVYLHRFIMGAESGMEVDHINHNTLDNRKENLRIVTHSQNLQNPSGACINSKSGVRGISWRPDMKKWEVQLQADKRSYGLGWYEELGTAEHVVCEARRYFMPYSEEFRTMGASEFLGVLDDKQFVESLIQTYGGRKRQFAWSYKWPSCIECGETKHKHHGNGMCSCCYGRWLKEQRFGPLRQTVYA
jgi:hypothetical protein